MPFPSRLSTPKHVEIAVTGRCNLRCRYCFYAEEMTAHADLPADVWLAFFDELSRLAVMEVGLTGGEVFTRPDLFDLIDGITARRMRYSLCSNGTLLDEQMLARFAAGKRRLRLNFIQLSVDGSRAEIHNRSRPDSFEATLRALRLLKEAEFPVVVRVTINPHNLGDLDGIARLLLDDIGLPSFSTNETFPMGNGCTNQSEVTLGPRGQYAAIRTLDRLLERYPGRITALAGPLAKRRAYAEMEESRRTGVKTPRWDMGFLTACGCVFSRLGVLHNGDIVPCPVLHRQVLGNLCRDSIADIWQHHPVLTALRERRSIPMHEVPGCEDCEWTAYCNGSCPGVAQETTGNFNLANPDDCFRRFLAGNQLARL
jgi:SynChlorMet cassette radical SAM/SPASM protein ScmE